MAAAAAAIKAQRDLWKEEDLKMRAWWSEPAPSATRARWAQARICREMDKWEEQRARQSRELAERRQAIEGGESAMREAHAALAKEKGELAAAMKDAAEDVKALERAGARRARRLWQRRRRSLSNRKRPSTTGRQASKRGTCTSGQP